MNRIIFCSCVSFLFIHTATAQFGNYFAGTNAGTGNTGSYITGVGYNAIHNNNTGSFNSAFGYASLYSNTTGSGNIAFGYKTLFLNTIGYRNTAVGDSALYSNISGAFNNAYGDKSLSSNTTGIYNNAFGNNSLNLNTTGYYNNAFGALSLSLNTTGSANNAFGGGALYSNTIGSSNHAFGDNALSSNQTGSFNNAFGSFALFINKTGAFNVAFGYRSLFHNIGSNNAGFGDSSLFSNSAGDYNAAVGGNAGARQTNYNKCTFIGANADASKDSFTNATAIGYGAIVNGKNKVRVGNNAVKSIGGAVGWSTLSDKRLKTNIHESKLGLQFIQLLRPVMYNYKDENQKNVLYTGLVAQEVDEVAKKLNIEYSGVDKNGEYWGIRYGDLTVPLIKAVQELGKMNNDKDVVIDELQKHNENLERRVAKLEAILNSNQFSINSQYLTVLTAASVQQNIPNPFTNSTIINYTLPHTYSSAKIIITDKNGKILNEANLSGSGNGSYKVDASLLAGGAYQYSLYVNNKLIDTKQMLLSK